MRKLRLLGPLFCGMSLLLCPEVTHAQDFWQQTNGPVLVLWVHLEGTSLNGENDADGHASKRTIYKD